MTLSAGQRLGVYEIVAPLGAGGIAGMTRATPCRFARAVPAGLSLVCLLLPAVLTENGKPFEVYSRARLMRVK